MTQAGIVLGTAAYMSPEQAKGRPADKRSDVWAFGCVLYEMLAGKRAFPGDDVVDTLSAVMRVEPDFHALPPDVPESARLLIQSCLVKDRRARIGDIAAAQFALRLPAHESSSKARPSRRFIGWAAAAVVVAAATGLLSSRFASPPPEPPAVVRSLIPAPGFGGTGFYSIAMSRQGTHLAYASQGRIAVRRLSEAVVRPLQGTEGGMAPFFSPDGEWIAFFTASHLKKIPVAGGAAQVIAQAPSGRGGSWSADGTIVFSPMAQGGLMKIQAAGGPVTPLTTLKPDEQSHRWPQVLPDGRNVLFTIRPEAKSFDDAIIATVPISGGEPRPVVDGGTGGQFVESGHLLYSKGGSLLATRFDPVAVRAAGAAITVIDNVRTNALNGAVPIAVSAAGSLVYLSGVGVEASMALLTANRAGQTRPLLDRRVFNNSFRISPDGKRLALSANDGEVDIWIVELDAGGLRRFTIAGAASYPVWSPDGSRLYYLSNARGVPRAVSRAVDNSGAEETLSQTAILPMTISPNGAIVSGRQITTTNQDVVAVDVRTKQSSAIAATAANESEPAFSPDGRYVAYQSDESGRAEVYVQVYPTGNRWQITTAGGAEPRWTSGGRELIFRNGTTLFTIPIGLQPFVAGTPQALFSIPNLFAFDVSADGKRFVVAQDAESRDAANFVLVSGWFEELKAKMRPTR
jgi:serine/threonine-protein kinase